MDANNVNVNLIRGHMDTIILRTLQNQDKYGLEILNEIRDLSENLYSLKQPTLYNSLKRLEKQGLITSYPGDISNGANRTYYSLTDEGRTFLEIDQKEWEFSRSIIDKLLSDKEFDINDETPFNTADFRPLTKRSSNTTTEVEKIVEVEKVVYKYLHPITNEELTKEEYDNVVKEIKENYEKSIAFPTDFSEEFKETSLINNNKYNETLLNSNNSNDNNTTPTQIKTTTINHLPNEKFFDVNEYDFLFENNDDDVAEEENQLNSYNDTPFETEPESSNTDSSVFYNSIYQESNKSTKDERTVDELFATSENSDNIPNIQEKTDIKEDKNNVDLFHYDTKINYDLINREDSFDDNEKVQSNFDFFNSIYSDKENQYSPYEDFTTPSISEIKSNFDFKKLDDELSKQNIKLKTYEKTNTIDYYTNKYCYINKLFRDFSIVIFLIFNTFLYSMFFTLKDVGGLTLTGILVTSGISLLLPIFALILYLINPTKRIRNIPTLTSAFLTSLILVITFTIVTVIIGFFIINIDITMPKEYIPAIVMPIASVLIVPIGVLLYSFLYNRKHYRVG